MATPEPDKKRVEVTVSTRTMLTVFGALGLAWAFLEARQAVLWVFIALFLAIPRPIILAVRPPTELDQCRRHSLS